MIPENVDCVLAAKYEASKAAFALFDRLYNEAMRKPMNEALVLLAALRDLVVSNPAFEEQCQCLGELVDSAAMLKPAE